MLFRRTNEEATTTPTATTPTTTAPTNPENNFKETTSDPSKPNQPRSLSFPKTTFGKDPKQRSFNPTWFDKFPWLHYDQNKDAAFCFTCLSALRKSMISATKAETVFTETGYRNWKKALESGRGFSKHECSDSHKEATERLITAPGTSKDIGEIMVDNLAATKERNRRMLLKLLQSVRYLGRQSLPFRGNWDEETHSELNSNFHQLLLLRCEDDKELSAWLAKKQNYTSPAIQNEMLRIEALSILRDIAKNIQSAEIFTILADETGDVSNTEQLVICIRWVDDELQAHEEFIGLHPLPDTSADQIVFLIKDILLRMNLKLENARGQCYDGAASMAGHRSGVATQIKSLNEKCLYTHCYGHALNLAVGDVIKEIPELKEAFGTAYEICKLVKKSPKRDTQLKNIREATGNESKSVHEFSPTRWTVRGQVLESFLKNYKELMELWTWSLSNVKLPDMRARINGVMTVMSSFNFVFCCCLGETLLKHTDNLSRSLQGDISAAEGQQRVSEVLAVLEKTRSNELFELFWERVLVWKSQLGVSDPKLPRKRKMPDYFNKVSDGPPETYHFHDTAKDRYRHVYFETFDLVINYIQQRFDQPDYKTYVNLQEVLLKSITGQEWESHLKAVCRFYEGDINESLAKVQIPLLPVIASNLGYDKEKFKVTDLIKLLQSFDQSQRTLLSEVVKIAKLLLVMPSTNAISERSFSALKRVKTYLRSTTTNLRLNNLMVLHIHTDSVEKMDLTQIGDEFIDKHQSRIDTFGYYNR